MRLLGGVVRLQRLAIFLDVAIDTRKLLGQPLARLDARLARVTMEEGAVDRHKLATQKLKLAQQKHKFPARRLLEATRGADPIEVAVKIGLQQICRMIARLSRPAATTGMQEPKLLNI